MNPPLAGGVSGLTPITPELKQLAVDHKSHAEAKLGQTFSHFEPVEYAQQVVAGMNFIIRVDVGDGKHVHVKIYRNLKKEHSFTDAWHEDKQH